MTTVPLNLSLIREDFRNPRTLSQIKADMLAAPTDYVMVVWDNDELDITGVLEGDVHYLTTHVSTRRAFRFTRPLPDYEPIHLLQYNYLSRPILHQSLVPLFPETAVDPWHTVLVRAQTQGASFSQVAGSHTIVELWPRPERGGVYAEYDYPFDAVAIMEVVPTVLVEEINRRPFYTLLDSRAEAVTAFCHNCSDDFMADLAAPNVTIEILLAPDYERVRNAKTNHVAWFDGIAEAVTGRTLNQLQVGLEFPGVSVISPRVLTVLSPETYSRQVFSAVRGITVGFSSSAWLAQTRDLGLSPPIAGYSNTRAILREIL